MNPNNRDQEASEAFNQFALQFSEEYGGLRFYAIVKMYVELMDNPENYDNGGNGNDFRIDGDLF